MSEDLDECARRLLATDVEHHQDYFNDAYAGGPYSVSWADVAYQTLREAGAAAIPALVRRMLVSRHDAELYAIGQLIAELPACADADADALGVLIVPLVDRMPHGALDVVAWAVGPRLLADARRELAKRILERAATGDHTARLVKHVTGIPALRAAITGEDIPPSLRGRAELGELG